MVRQTYYTSLWMFYIYIFVVELMDGERAPEETAVLVDVLEGGTGGRWLIGVTIAAFRDVCPCFKLFISAISGEEYEGAVELVLLVWLVSVTATCLGVSDEASTFSLLDEILGVVVWLSGTGCTYCNVFANVLITLVADNGSIGCCWFKSLQICFWNWMKPANALATAASEGVWLWVGNETMASFDETSCVDKSLSVFCSWTDLKGDTTIVLDVDFSSVGRPTGCTTAVIGTCVCAGDCMGGTATIVDDDDFSSVFDGSCPSTLVDGNCNDTLVDGTLVDGSCGGTLVDSNCDSTLVDGSCDGTLVDGNCDGTLVDGNCDGTLVDGSCDGTLVDGNCGGILVDGSCGGTVVDGNCGGTLVDGNCGGTLVDGNCGGTLVDGSCSGKLVDGSCDDILTEGDKELLVIKGLTNSDASDGSVDT